MTRQEAQSDTDIQRAVQHELSKDTRVSAHTVGVTVDCGVVELTGTVLDLDERMAAQEAAHRTPGVCDVANEIRVGVSSGFGLSDVEVAHAVRGALQRAPELDPGSIQSTVTHGWVLLEGTVESDEQFAGVESAVRNLIGVCGVNNELRLAGTTASDA